MKIKKLVSIVLCFSFILTMFSSVLGVNAKTISKPDVPEIIEVNSRTKNTVYFIIKTLADETLPQQESKYFILLYFLLSLKDLSEADKI